jgi:hypothetical protein
MTAPKVQAELGEHSAFLAGDMGIVHAALKIVGCPRQYDRKRRAMAVPRRHFDDMCAALESRFGADVEVLEGLSR